MVYGILAFAWAGLMIFKIIQLERKHQQDFRIAVKDRAKTEIENERRNNEYVCDADYHEISEYESVRSELKVLADCQKEAKPFLERCIDDLDQAMSFEQQIKLLKEKSYNSSAFEGIEDSLQEVQDGVIQNSKDILVLCYSNRFGKTLHLEQYEIDAIEKELTSNRRRLEKFKKLIRECAHYATQKDNDSSDLNVDSWTKVVTNLNKPTPEIKGAN